MIGLLCFVLAVLASPFKSKLRLEAENAVLRQQLIVLKRRLHGRIRLTNNDRWFFTLNMLREYPNNVTFHDRGFIEQLGGYFFDSVAMGHELRLPRDAWRTFYLCELIHRGVADLTLHRFVVVHHRK